MENVNYERWSINVLRRVAAALDLTLTVRFESFGKALEKLEGFEHQLVEPSFDEDPVFTDSTAVVPLKEFIDPEDTVDATYSSLQSHGPLAQDHNPNYEIIEFEQTENATRVSAKAA